MPPKPPSGPAPSRVIAPGQVVNTSTGQGQAPTSPPPGAPKGQSR